MPVQQYNDEMIALLTGDFQRRYEPNFAWKSAASSLIGLPGLRGTWTFGDIDAGPSVYNAGGQARGLTVAGNPTFGHDNLVPYCLLDGVGDYYSRADEAALDITGAETYIVPASRGLSMGIWVYPTVIGATQDIIGKWNTGPDDRSYLIRLLNTNVFQVLVSSAGTLATVANTNSTVAVSANNWYFVEMTYSPTGQSNLLTINVNGTITSAAAGTASLHSGAADFVVGASDNGASNLLTGRVSLSWLCAMYHPDYLTEVIREQSRAMYGV